MPAGYTYVDGIVGDIGHGVLRDRRMLSEEGVVVVIVTVDSTTGEIVTGPEIVTRGWVYAPEAEDLIEDAKQVVRESIAAAADEGATDFDTMRRHARKSLGAVHRRTHSAPPGGDPGRDGSLRRTRACGWLDIDLTGRPRS